MLKLEGENLRSIRYLHSLKTSPHSKTLSHYKGKDSRYFAVEKQWRNPSNTSLTTWQVNITCKETCPHHVPSDIMKREGRSITSVVFLPKMDNLNVITLTESLANSVCSINISFFCFMVSWCLVLLSTQGGPWGPASTPRRRCSLPWLPALWPHLFDPIWRWCWKQLMLPVWGLWSVPGPYISSVKGPGYSYA